MNSQFISSLDIADAIGKKHHHILRDIDSFKKSNKGVSASFVEDKYQVSGQVRHYKFYWVDRDFADKRWLGDYNSFIVKNEREKGALAAIEQLLNVRLERQYIVGKYRIDGYDKENNVAYEIDEKQHFIYGRLKQECVDRQEFIEKEIGCKFVRIKV